MNQFNNITKKFYIIYHKLLINKNEYEFSKELDEILEQCNVENFITIPNIKKIIYYLKNKHIFAYNICLLSYIRSSLLKKYSFSHSDSPIIIIDKLNNYLEYITSYSQINPISDLDNDVFFNIDDEEKTLNKDAWYTATIQEIYDRFLLLTKYFGVDFLLMLGIKQISYDELHSFNSIQLINFYNKIIKKITKKIKNFQDHYNALIDIEFVYARTILTGIFDNITNEYDIIVIEENIVCDNLDD